MKWSREQYLALALGQDVGRQMFCELFGPLIGLEDEWRAQGASEAEVDMTAFCWDYVAHLRVGSTGFIRTQKPRVIEDTPDYTISVDELGRKVKLPKGFATIALPMDFPVKDMESWLRVKHMLEFDESRVNRDRLLEAKKAQSEGAVITAGIPGGYDVIRELMGDEMACMAFYDDPEMVRDILATCRATCEKVFERVLDVVSPDVLCVHEDMAGKSGPLLGPNLVREFIKPYYLSSWNMLKQGGAVIFSQDSDGDMSPVVEVFMECGLNRFYPCEPVGNMDMVAMRKKYGDKLMFKGGIDKHALRGGRERIIKELEYRLQPCMRTGGVVFALDHRIPNGTPLEDYRFYVNTAREMLGREPITEDSPGWARMAF